MKHVFSINSRLNEMRKSKVNSFLSKNNELNDKGHDRLRILVITGASGGHIFPALGFLDILKDKHKNTDTLLVLPKGSIIDQIETFDNKINYISISPLRLSLNFKNLVAVFKFLKGSLESIFIIWRFRPAIVVGFGSLTSVPMVLFAWALGIKTLIHEQNVIPGRANRLLAKFTDRIAISFAQTRDYFKDYPKKITLTGNPIRKELIRIDKNKALDFFGFSNDKFTILVMGGSHGSYRINDVFLKTISTIPDPNNLQIIHITGLKDYDLLKLNYQNLNVNVKLFNFLRSMQYAYSACDLILSRAGATTIAEIIFFRLPAIIIPYPYAYKHQFNNAKILERIGSAVIIEDNKLDACILRQIIDEYINNPDRLFSMRSRYDSILKTNANDLLVDEVLFLYNIRR